MLNHINKSKPNRVKYSEILESTQEQLLDLFVIVS